MTDVDIITTYSGIELTANNHAGNRVICAVCSANICNMINALEKELDDDHLEYLRWDVEKGYSRVEAKVKPEHHDRFEGICEVITIGFKALAAEYPKQVQVTVR